MRIAVICPIGYLDRHGYQHVYEPCIRSMSEFAQKVYLVQSIDAPVGVERARFENVEVISEKCTWFEDQYTATR